VFVHLKHLQVFVMHKHLNRFWECSIIDGVGIDDVMGDKNEW
jgi:hypothetical protein